ncbi:MAG: hypothetical protein ACJA0V_002527 [Planctomycetota bacterium]|jgi:hypothetical protein
MLTSISIRLSAACLALALAPFSLAQSTPAIGPNGFVSAVHEGAAPPDSQYGVWASGADYKASFHNGFVFYPLLGESSPHNLPLRWTSTEVRVGKTVVTNTRSNPELRRSARRVEFDHGPFVEVYDLRADGVEQSFVFNRPLGGSGDLVVAGRVDTELAAAVAQDRHQALEFCDATGKGIVRYGAAIVVDSSGWRQPVSTAWNGQRVELRIGAEFLARATYPIRLDPLIARINLATGTSPVVDLDMIVAPDAGPPKLVVVYSRAFAGNDIDSYAIVCDTDFSNPVTVFADVNASWSTKDGRCSYSGDAHRWALVFERELFAPTTSSILAYCHDRANTNLNSGTSGTLQKPAGTTARNPDIGGRRPGGGPNVLIVYQTDITTTQQNTVNTETWGVLVNPGTAAQASVPTTLDWFTAGTTYDREHPTLVKMSDGTFGFWIVAWHEFFAPANPDDWDINITRFSFTGIHQAQRYRLGFSVAPPHKRFPQLSGGEGRFMLAMTYSQSDATPMADEIHVQRFDWPDAQYDPVVSPPVVIASDPFQPNFAYPRLAFDENTRSHWALTYRRGLTSAGDLFAVRLGPDGTVLESNTLFQSPGQLGGATAVTFTPENGGSFPIAYATDEAGAPVFATQLLYPPGADNTAYGIGCGGVIGASSPYLGSQFFEFTLTGAQPSQIAALGMASYQQALPFVLLPLGCEILIGSDGGWIPVITGPTGDAAVTIPLVPSLPPGLTVFTQWLHLDSSGSPAFVLASGGLRTRLE